MSAAQCPPVRILGIGSPAAPDDLGFRAIQALARRFDANEVQVLALDRPGPRLIEHLRGAFSVILVDAVKSGAAPGTLVQLDGRIDGRKLAALDRQHQSSHGIGLAETLALAEQLAELPARLQFIGMEVADDPLAAEDLARLIDAIEKAAANEQAALRVSAQ
jgi:hydrogenase maturation protease